MLTRSLRLKERAGDLHQLAVAHNNFAELLLGVGDLSSALDLALHAVALATKARAESDIPEMHRMVSAITLPMGKLRTAIEHGIEAMQGAVSRAPLYVADAAKTLTEACVRGAADSDESTRALARQGAVILRAAWKTHFLEGDGVSVAAECERALQSAGL